MAELKALLALVVASDAAVEIAADLALSAFFVASEAAVDIAELFASLIAVVLFVLNVLKSVVDTFALMLSAFWVILLSAVPSRVVIPARSFVRVVTLFAVLVSPSAVLVTSASMLTTFFVTESITGFEYSMSPPTWTIACRVQMQVFSVSSGTVFCHVPPVGVMVDVER